MHWVQSVSWPKPLQPHGAKCGTAISSAGSNLLDTFQHVNFVPAGSMPDQISPACTTLCWIKYSPSSCHQHKAEIKWQSQYRFCILCSMGRQPRSHPWPTSIYYLWAHRSGTVQPQPEDVITQPLFQEKIEFEKFPLFCLTQVSCSHPYTFNLPVCLCWCNWLWGCAVNLVRETAFG